MLRKKKNSVQDPGPTLIEYPEDNLADCKLALEKNSGLYGLQYECWVNPKLQRGALWSRIREGDQVTFRWVPWERGRMCLCIHRHTGIDIGVLPNELACEINQDYYGCFIVGTVIDTQRQRVNIQIWQPPYEL